MENSSIIEQIRAIATAEDAKFVSALIQGQPGKMDPEVQQAFTDKLKAINEQSKALRDETVSILKVHGVEYPLTDWLTPKNYVSKFGIKNVETVLNWINRGIIPAENVKEIPELGIRLVKAVEYTPRAYKQASEEQDA